MIDTLTLIGMGSLGILLYNLFALKSHIPYLHTATFWETYKSEGKYMFSLWGFAFVTLVAVIINIDSDTTQAISTLTGMDVGGSRAAFFTLGLTTTSLADTKD